jgi:hypothetical protein
MLVSQPPCLVKCVKLVKVLSNRLLSTFGDLRRPSVIFLSMRQFLSRIQRSGDYLVLIGVTLLAVEARARGSRDAVSHVPGVAMRMGLRFTGAAPLTLLT